MLLSKIDVLERRMEKMKDRYTIEAIERIHSLPNGQEVLSSAHTIVSEAFAAMKEGKHP